MARSILKILTRSNPTDLDSVHLGLLRPPWIQSKYPQIPGAVLFMANRNYKVCADRGLDAEFMISFLSVVHTGSGPMSFLQVL